MARSLVFCVGCHHHTDRYARYAHALRARDRASGSRRSAFPRRRRPGRRPRRLRAGIRRAAVRTRGCDRPHRGPGGPIGTGFLRLVLSMPSRSPPSPPHATGATSAPAGRHQVKSLTHRTLARASPKSLPESPSMPHPFRDVAIVGVYNTVQAREFPEHDSASIELEGALGALADAGMTPSDVDTVCTQFSSEDVLALGLGPATIRGMLPRITSVLDAAALIATGQSDVVLMAAGGAGVYTDRTATAPWTRPAHEFVVGYGLFTAAGVRAHRPPAHAHVRDHARAAGRGRRHHPQQRPRQPRSRLLRPRPYTADDILASRMVADPLPPPRLLHDLRRGLRRWC